MASNFFQVLLNINISSSCGRDPMVFDRLTLDQWFRLVGGICSLVSSDHRAPVISDMTMSSLYSKVLQVTRSQSSRAPLGCSGTGISIVDVQPTTHQQLCDAPSQHET